MSTRYRNVTRRIFLAINVIAVVLFFLACLAPYVDPTKWWAVSIIGLGFAFIIITLLAFIAFWLLFKPRYALLSVLALLIGWKSISVFFAFHIPDKFDYSKDRGTLRVVHWNVGRFVEWKRNNNKGSQTRLKMLDLIKEQNADVLCLQEFFHSKDTVYYDNLNHVMKDLGYPYYYYAWDNDGYLQWVGQIIFSRLPIVDSGMVRYPRPAIPESLLYADLLFGGDTVRVYTTHLQSVQFRKQDFEKIESIKNRDEAMVQHSRSIFGKLKRAFMYRATQSEVVKQMTSISPHPYILTGDFNDVPNSHTYFTIRGGLQDAFLETGFGVGRTYREIAPTLRIDYVFATKDFRIRQFNRLARNLGDHYMLVTDLQLR